MPTMKKIAIYAGTFDPVTLGHVDLIERANKLFDEVIVGIALNSNKKPLLDLSERVALTKSVLSGYTNLKILGFDCLLLDFAREHQASVIIRGLRTVSDFDYEFQLAGMNRLMDPTVETLFLVPSEKYMYISSSLIREIAFLRGNISSFVPPIVAKALAKKFNQGQET